MSGKYFDSKSRSSSSPYRRGSRDELHGHRQFGRATPRERREFREKKPMPIGDRCNPLCPHFKCSKASLNIRRRGVQQIAFCSWVGDNCIGHSCQYAYCELRALLPDGRCAYALRGKKEEWSFEEQLKRDVVESEKVKSILQRRKIIGEEDLF